MEDFYAVKDMDGVDFVNKILHDALGVSGVVCGWNFRFGRGASCTSGDLCDLCAKYDIDCSVVPPVIAGGEAISSSRIRSLILSGKTKEAADLLGRNHSYTLPVVHGKMLGRRLGFPTINQIIPENL